MTSPTVLVSPPPMPHSRFSAPSAIVTVASVVLLGAVGLFLVGSPAAQAEDPPSPRYWTEAATRTVDDLVFARDWTKPEKPRIFAMGVDSKSNGPWDGAMGPKGCKTQPDGTQLGKLNNGPAMMQAVADAGGNFIYRWGIDAHVNETLLATTPQLFGRFDDDWGTRRPKEKDIIPLIVNAYGESDLDYTGDDKPERMAADFADFQARRGKWSIENKPALPPYDDVPWMAWHPTWRIRGGGRNGGGALSDDAANRFAKALNHLFGDSYTYVVNREDSRFNALLGQKGETNEGYDDWLMENDADHDSYFRSSFTMSYHMRRRSNPDALVWTWQQGHAFDDDIGGGVCGSGGKSTLWARGPFPPMAYLRKEINGMIAVGGTGFVFFGYGYNRPQNQEKVLRLFRAYAHPDIYGPALLSPRLELPHQTWDDLLALGPDGKSHVIVKWDANSRRAYIVGATQGANDSLFSVTFPWTVAKAEFYQYEDRVFETDERLTVNDATVTFDSPSDDGFILRVTPAFAPGTRR